MLFLHPTTNTNQNNTQACLQKYAKLLRDRLPGAASAALAAAGVGVGGAYFVCFILYVIRCMGIEEK